MNETGLTKNQIIKELTRSPHGDLKSYVPIFAQAQKTDPEFLAHLLAWNFISGQIRDSWVGLPGIVLSQGNTHDEFVENALAHMAALDPKNMLRSIRFAVFDLKIPGYSNAAKRNVERFLRVREAKYFWWESAAVQHRRFMKELYALFHIRPSGFADSILFKRQRPKGSVFEVIKQLKDMSPAEAAGTIIERKIPFLVATGALGPKAKEPDLVLALINRMSPTELITNMKRLERLGVKKNPALRSALEEALGKAARSGKNVLKTTVAADAVADEALRANLQATQEKQLQNMRGIDGHWLVLADCSKSMEKAIEASRHVAATLAKMVRGNVHLVFFNTSPRHVLATGKTYDELLADTKHVAAVGGTSIGCGLQWALDRAIKVDGIAIVSDAAENNHPLFANVYAQYSQVMGKQVPVYLYRFPDTMYHPLNRDLAATMRLGGFDLQEFDLRGGVDYYSLPNIVATMRANRYSLIDEIMATPLLTFDKVFRQAA